MKPGRFSADASSSWMSAPPSGSMASIADMLSASPGRAAGARRARGAFAERCAAPPTTCIGAAADPAARVARRVLPVVCHAVLPDTMLAESLPIDVPARLACAVAGRRRDPPDARLPRDGCGEAG
jgi:hypothetical protein